MTGVPHGGSRGLRALRTAALTSASVGTGAAGHDLAGGAALPVGALVLLTVAVGALVAVLSHRRIGFGAALSLLLAGQVGVHLAAASAAGAAARASTGPAGPAAHHGPGSTGLPEAGHAAHAADLGPLMLAAHLGVAVLWAVMWCHGEAILFAVAKRLGPPTADPLTPGPTQVLRPRLPLLQAASAPSPASARGPPRLDGAAVARLLPLR